jgi:hypothetical protein
MLSLFSFLSILILILEFCCDPTMDAIPALLLALHSVESNFGSSHLAASFNDGTSDLPEAQLSFSIDVFPASIFRIPCGLLFLL